MLQNLITKGQRLACSLGYDIRRVMSVSEERELYRSLYSDGDLKNRAFANIGAGRFRHPYWTNVDHTSDWYSSLQSSGQVEWDIMSMKPCPIESDCMNVVYSSHTIEHLTDDGVQHLFEQAFRMLKPGGVFRITAPDAELLYDAYIHDDELFIDNEHGVNPQGWHQASLEEKIIYCIASQRVGFHPEAKPESVLDTAMIREQLSTSLMKDAFNSIVKECSLDIQTRHPGNHINWWSPSKVSRFMEQAGFGEIRNSAFSQSRCPVMRNPAYFDNTRPRISLYVEAQK